jgi:hypothetical protein
MKGENRAAEQTDQSPALRFTVPVEDLEFSALALAAKLRDWGPSPLDGQDVSGIILADSHAASLLSVKRLDPALHEVEDDGALDAWIAASSGGHAPASATFRRFLGLHDPNPRAFLGRSAGTPHGRRPVPSNLRQRHAADIIHHRALNQETVVPMSPRVIEHAQHNLLQFQKLTIV